MTWARAVAGACALLAQRDRRTVHLVMFAGSGDMHACTVRPGRPADLAAMFAHLSLPPRGGTDIVQAINEATSLANGKHSDLLVVTDGEFTLGPRELASKGKSTWHGVGIGSVSAPTTTDGKPVFDEWSSLSGKPSVDDAGDILSGLFLKKG